MSAINIVLTPGYQFVPGEILATAKLNLLGNPSAQLQGQLGTAQLEDASVTTEILGLNAVTVANIANDTFSTDGTSMAPFNTGFLAALYTNQSARPVGGRTNCVVTNAAGAPTSAVTIMATELALLDSNGNYFMLTNVNVMASILAAGVSNGLDTLPGTAASASTWYYLYVISNGTTTQGLISASSTAPTLPAGFIYFALVGAVFYNSASAFPYFYTQGRKTYVQEVNLTGITATTGWVAYSTSVATAIPPIATTAQGTATCNVAGDSNGNFGDSNLVTRFDIPVLASQTVYVKGSGSSNRLSFTSYDW